MTKYLVTIVSSDNSNYQVLVRHDFVETSASEREIVFSYLPFDWNIDEWAHSERRRCSYDIDDDGDVSSHELMDHLWEDVETRDQINYNTSGDREMTVIVVRKFDFQTISFHDVKSNAAKNFRIE